MKFTEQIKFCQTTSLLEDKNINSKIILLSKHYLFNVSNRDLRRSCKTCSQFIIKTSSERRQKRRSGVIIVNFEHISQSNYCWVLLANVCWVVKLRLLMQMD